MVEHTRWIRSAMFGLLVAALLAAAQGAGPSYSVRPASGQEPGAVLRDGQVYADPLADPRELLLLDADNVLVTDGELGFVVGVGPRFGGPDENGLAARQPLAQGLPEPHEITRSDGRILITTRGDGGVVEFDLGTGQVTPLVQGITAPRQVASLPFGVAVVDAGTAVVLASSDPDVDRIVVPVDDPRGLAASDQTVWTCANGADELVAIDVASGRADPLLPVPDPTDVVALPIGAPAGLIESLLVESGGTQVLVVDPASGAAAPVPEFTDGIPTLPDGFSLPPPEPQEQPDIEPPAADEGDVEVEEDEPPTVGTDEPADDAGADDEPETLGEDALPLPSDGAGLPWWVWLVLLVPFPVAAGWGVVRGRGRQGALEEGVAPPIATEPPDTGGSVDMVPADPCEDLRIRCRAARQRCEDATAACGAAIAGAEQAEQAAQDATRAADEARAEAAAARTAAAAAAKALDAASERPEEGSSVSDDRGRITQRDLGLKRAASKAAWGRYQSGEISAGQLEAEWESLGERDAIDKLREQDEEHRADRIAEAESARAAADAALAAAESAAAAADAAADAATDASTAANAARDEACAAAEAACTEADRVCDELAECERREKERQEAEAAAAAAAAAAAEAEEAARREQPPPVTPPVPTSGGGGGGRKPCCPDCLWVGYGYMTAGMSLFAGLEYTTIHLHCASDPSIWITLECQTLRLGLGVGGEGAAVGAVAFGCSPSDAVTAIRSALNGNNGDLSVGVPATKLLKQAGKSGDIARAARLLRKLGDKKLPPTKLPTRDLAGLKQAGDALKGSLQGSAKAGAVQTANAGGAPSGLVLPLGAGLQIGVWRGVSTKVWVTGMKLPPGCVGPPGYSRG